MKSREIFPEDKRRHILEDCKLFPMYELGRIKLIEALQAAESEIEEIQKSLLDVSRSAISRMDEKDKQISLLEICVVDKYKQLESKDKEIAELKEKLTENYQIVSKLSTENRLQLSEIQSLKEEIEKLKRSLGYAFD